MSEARAGDHLGLLRSDKGITRQGSAGSGVASAAGGGPPAAAHDAGDVGADGGAWYIAGETATKVIPLTPDVSERRAERQAWLREVADRTQHFRRARAARMRRRGHVVAQANPQRARWHYARATGEVERFERAATCGQGQRLVRLDCRLCGSVHDIQPSCGGTLACTRCRDISIRRWRARFLRAREEQVKLIGRRMRGYGAYSDKLVTLVAPHAGDAEERIEWVRRAVTIFSKWWREHMPRPLGSRHPGRVWQATNYESRGGHWRLARIEEQRGYAWSRAFEWKLGADAQGHPHAHIWALCPYLPQWEVTRAWRRALAAAHPPYEAEPAWPIPIRVDIRRKSVREVMVEVVKYITKDVETNADGTHELVSPEIYAIVYQLFAGRRRIQSSRGFMGLAGNSPCPDCHATRYEHRRKDGAFGYMTGPRRARMVPIECGLPLMAVGPPE